jgi:RND family efflux transporter MFP subunit
MRVEVTPPSLPDLHREGTITEISPVLDPVTRTANVTVAIDNADHALRPGMVADVSIELGRRPGVTMVPARAVLMTTRTETAQEGQVFVVEGDVARRRTVVLGPRYADAMEIVSGLRAGERVVTMGQHLLRDGSKIRVSETARPEPVARAAEAR